MQLRDGELTKRWKEKNQCNHYGELPFEQTPCELANKTVESERDAVETHVFAGVPTQGQMSTCNLK